MTAPDRADGIGRLTTRTLLDALDEMREDIQAQSVILAEMEMAIQRLFGEMRRANARCRPAADQ